MASSNHSSRSVTTAKTHIKKTLHCSIYLYLPRHLSLSTQSRTRSSPTYTAHTLATSKSTSKSKSRSNIRILRDRRRVLALVDVDLFFAGPDVEVRGLIQLRPEPDFVADERDTEHQDARVLRVSVRSSIHSFIQGGRLTAAKKSATLHLAGKKTSKPLMTTRVLAS